MSCPSGTGDDLGWMRDVRRDDGSGREHGRTGTKVRAHQVGGDGTGPPLAGGLADGAGQLLEDRLVRRGVGLHIGVGGGSIGRNVGLALQGRCGERGGGRWSMVVGRCCLMKGPGGRSIEQADHRQSHRREAHFVCCIVLWIFTNSPVSVCSSG